MMRPRYGAPINTAKDMVKHNITLFEMSSHFDALKQFLLSVDVPEWTHIANNMIAVEGGRDGLFNGTRDLLQATGKYAYLRGYVEARHLRDFPMDKWWKSTETRPGENPYGGFLTAKKWILNEVADHNI